MKQVMGAESISPLDFSNWTAIVDDPVVRNHVTPGTSYYCFEVSVHDNENTSCVLVPVLH